MIHDDPKFFITIFGKFSTHEVEDLEDRLQQLLTARELNGRIDSDVTTNSCAIHTAEFYKQLSDKHWDNLIKPRHNELTAATTEKTDNNG